MANKYFIDDARTKLVDSISPSLAGIIEEVSPGPRESDPEFERASGPPIKKSRQISRPFYFSVTNSSVAGPGYDPVNLFFAAQNLTTFNFGNIAANHIASLYPGITYGGLLSVTIDQPFIVETIKLESASPGNLQVAFAFTETQYIGESNTTSYVPYIKLDQINLGAVEVPVNKEIITSSTLVSLTMVRLSSINLKIYPQYIEDYSRVLEHKGMKRDFQSPNPYMLPGKRKIYLPS